MVERLEEQQDEVAGFAQEDVPSGDAIAGTSSASCASSRD